MPAPFAGSNILTGQHLALAPPATHHATRMQIKIIRANDLLNRDLFRKPDPFVLVRVLTGWCFFLETISHFFWGGRLRHVLTKDWEGRDI